MACAINITIKQNVLGFICRNLINTCDIKRSNEDTVNIIQVFHKDGITWNYHATSRSQELTFQEYGILLTHLSAFGDQDAIFTLPNIFMSELLYNAFKRMLNFAYHDNIEWKMYTVGFNMYGELCYETPSAVQPTDGTLVYSTLEPLQVVVQPVPDDTTLEPVQPAEQPFPDGTLVYTLEPVQPVE